MPVLNFQATNSPVATSPVANSPVANSYDADIVILALDRAVETVAAIGSALAQVGVSRHVIIVDQGSQPEALAQIEACVAGRPDATLVYTGRNLGVAGGRNLGASRGQGRVIVALDNDAVFADASTVARAVAVLDAAPDLGAIGFRIVVDATGTDDLSSWGYPSALLTRAGDSFDAATFVGAGHAIRRVAWDAARGYDAALFFCWEEFDFCLRAAASGWRIRYRGDLIVRHKVSAERRVTWSDTRWFYYVRNRLYIARKWGAGWGTLAPRVIGYLLKGLRGGLLAPTLRAIGAAARMQVAARPAPAVLRVYLARTDRAHRGRWTDRLRTEVFARLPGA